MHRPTTSPVAGALQQAGMIRYNRGRMTILQRRALEDVCADCYDVVNRQFERTLGTMPKKQASPNPMAPWRTDDASLYGVRSRR